MQHLYQSNHHRHKGEDVNHSPSHSSNDEVVNRVVNALVPKLSRLINEDPWATERQAAKLAGFTLAQFKHKRKELEALGFPKASIHNGKWYKPHIMRFNEMIQGVKLKRQETPEDLLDDLESIRA
jgi:hypothetical protein